MSRREAVGGADVPCSVAVEQRSRGRGRGLCPSGRWRGRGRGLEGGIPAPKLDAPAEETSRRAGPGRAKPDQAGARRRRQHPRLASAPAAAAASPRRAALRARSRIANGCQLNTFYVISVWANAHFSRSPLQRHDAFAPRFAPTTSVLQ